VIQIISSFVEKNSHYESCLLKIILDFETLYCKGDLDLGMMVNYPIESSLKLPN